MFDRVDQLLKKIVGVLSEIAGWSLFACMCIVTINVVLRRFFNSPLLGAYEWVGILTATTISFGLAYCGSVGAHIAIDFIVEKMKPGVQKILAVVFGGISMIFMGGLSISIILYANKLAMSGEVSPTTKIPFYIFIYFVGLGFLLLFFVLLLDIIKCIRRKKNNVS